MKNTLAGCGLGLMLLAGCADTPTGNPSVASSNPSPSSSQPKAGRLETPSPLDRVEATVNGRPFTLGQMIGPLVEAHGLTLLVNLVQLDQAKLDAEKAGVIVTDADFQAERQNTLDNMFKEASAPTLDQIDNAEAHNDQAKADKLRSQLRSDEDSLLDQFLNKEHISPVEFDILLKINTYMRKLAEPVVNRSINEDSIKAAFNQLYGETVEVRCIQLANQTEVAAAQQRLAKGEPFDVVARDMSHDRASGELGGLLPRFSRQAPGFSLNFKDVAFGLQPGQVSDPVESDGAWYLIKMEERYAPRAIKYERVHDAVRRQLFDAAVKSAVKQLREDLARRVVAGLRVTDPVLAKQFDQRVADRGGQANNATKIRQDLDREHNQPPAAPKLPLPATATQPAGAR